MKKMKRFLSLLLSCVMLLSMLAACGSNQSTSQPTVGENGELPNASGTATSVTYWMDPQNLSSSILSGFDESLGWQAYEEGVGVDIVWKEPANGQAAEQFNLIIASKEMPDIMYYSWLTSYPGGPDAAIADGKIVRLNEYIEQYAPNFYAYLQAHPDIAREITTDTGNIYCFPAVYTYTSQDSDTWQNTIDREPYEESFIGLIIRKDLLEQAGLDMPETIDDWYTTLKAFKEMGIKYPLSCMVTYATLAQTFSASFDVTLPVIGIGGGMGADFALREDGTIQYGPAEDNYYDYLSFMHKLYEEGLLDPDFMVQDQTTMYTKISNGEVGVWVSMLPGGIGGLEDQARAIDPDTTFDACGVANPIREEGATLRYRQGNLAYTGSGAAITTSCKDIATACRVLDYGWSDEGNNFLNWGIEGESYEIVDGWPQLTQQILSATDSTISEAFSRYRNLNGPYPQDHSQRLTSKRNYSLAEGVLDENIDALDIWSSERNGSVRAGLPSVTMLAEEANEYSTAYNEINTYVQEMFAKFIMGTEPLENFDKYQETLYSMGLERVLELQTGALERYYERQVG